MGMLTAGTTKSGMLAGGADDPASGDDATKSMYHDYLTNPNSTYAQDPALAPQLKAATAPGVTPGTLSGSPGEVAKQGLTGDAYDKWFSKAFHTTPEGILIGNDMSGGGGYQSNTTGTGGSSSVASPAAPMAIAPVQSYSAAQTKVTPGMLAAGNLASIMDPNSPLMMQAATQGNQQANKRGLQNSSIGISAAQDSMLRAATPIAQQDASTQANIGMRNTDSLNNASQFNAGANNTAALTGQQLSSQQTIAKLNSDTQLAVQKMSGDTQAKMAEITQANQKLLQSNSQAATAMANYSATVANIQSSKDMNATAKQQAVDTQLTNLRNTLAALQSQSGQDLSQFFPMLAAGEPEPTTGHNPKYGNYGENL